MRAKPCARLRPIWSDCHVLGVIDLSRRAHLRPIGRYWARLGVIAAPDCRGLRPGRLVFALLGVIDTSCRACFTPIRVDTPRSGRNRLLSPRAFTPNWTVLGSIGRNDCALLPRITPILVGLPRSGRNRPRAGQAKIEGARLPRMGSRRLALLTRHYGTQSPSRGRCGPRKYTSPTRDVRNFFKSLKNQKSQKTKNQKPEKQKGPGEPRPVNYGGV